MANDLIATPSILAGLPGSPFTPEEIDAAVADVRAAAQWHIAPQKSATVTLDVVCGERRLRLPTRQLVSVTSITDTDTSTVLDPTTYRVSKTIGQVMKKSGYWPAGFGRIQVAFTHGYDSVPLDLLKVVAEAANMARREQSIRSVQIDDFQQQFGTVAAGTLGTDETLLRYSLPGNPLNLGIA